MLIRTERSNAKDGVAGCRTPPLPKETTFSGAFGIGNTVECRRKKQVVDCGQTNPIVVAHIVPCEYRKLRPGVLGYRYCGALSSKIQREAGKDRLKQGMSRLRLEFPRGGIMLRYALVFFVVALIAAAFGFLGIAAAAVSIARLLFYVFLILFLVSLIGGLVRRT
jgi:uncharacterized membrane protein YtjA (UPF0391 family)